MTNNNSSFFLTNYIKNSNNMLFAIFINKLDRTLKFVKRYFKKIERVMGLLLWTVGLLMLTGGFSSISFWLLEIFPSLGALG